MTNVILVAHILVSIVLVIVVLMQRSEGGALGIGGGGGGAGGGLMSGQGVKGALVRTTIIFGAIFFISSLTLTTMATKNNAGGLTDVQRELEGDLPAQPETDELNIDGLEDILSSDESLLEDPLAVSPAETSAEEQPETDPSAEDPLAEPTDPQ
ncbi:MAG: preprotein translocase subunit SecG [Pseudomonadota bacterium]|jgi:preprotein translocase subunit SecG|nr:preprotein translocase subunit SecG [Pseudomonadota bacterium]